MLYSGNLEIGTKISFSPIIFISATVFTLLTAIIASMRPANIAGSISPVAALRFSEVKGKKHITKYSRKRSKISNMAWKNVFRKRKSAALVFISLFLGSTLFLLTTGILSSLSAENFVNQWGDSDFTVSYDIQNEISSISESMVEEINKIDGVENLHTIYVSATFPAVDVVYDDSVFSEYIQSLTSSPNIKGNVDFSDPEVLDSYKQNFFSYIYGIDTYYVEELNKTLDTPIDIESFENGEIVLLTETLNIDGSNVFTLDNSITINNDQTGQHTFQIANGFLSADFQSGRGKIRGSAPDMYISINALEKISPQNKIYKVLFDTNGDNDEVVLAQLKAITSPHSEINIASRYEKRLEMSNYITTTKVLSMGLSIILLIIGVMNFVNTISVNVNSRRYELALLESIGMTKKQVKRMLVYEGIYYWSIPFILMFVFGTGIFIVLYSVFKQVVPYATFTYPTMQILVIMAIVFAICVLVPIFTYLSDSYKSLIDRLREI